MKSIVIFAIFFYLVFISGCSFDQLDRIAGGVERELGKTFGRDNDIQYRNRN